jgi:hypothetical protein
MADLRSAAGSTYHHDSPGARTVDRRSPCPSPLCGLSRTLGPVPRLPPRRPAARAETLEGRTLLSTYVATNSSDSADGSARPCADQQAANPATPATPSRRPAPTRTITRPPAPPQAHHLQALRRRASPSAAPTPHRLVAQRRLGLKAERGWDLGDGRSQVFVTRPHDDRGPLAQHHLDVSHPEVRLRRRRLLLPR